MGGIGTLSGVAKSVYRTLYGERPNFAISSISSKRRISNLTESKGVIPVRPPLASAKLSD